MVSESRAVEVNAQTALIFSDPSARVLQDPDGKLYAGLYSRDYEAAFGEYEMRCRAASSPDDPGREISEVKL